MKTTKASVAVVNEAIFDEAVTNEQRLTDYRHKRQLHIERPTTVFPLVVYGFNYPAQNRQHAQPAAQVG